MAKNTNPVLDLLRESWDSYDCYVSAMSAWFDIADCLYRYGADIPSDWDYSPGIGASMELDPEEASMFAVEIDLLMRQGHYSNLVHAGNVLERLVAQYKLAGMDC